MKPNPTFFRVSVKNSSVTLEKCGYRAQTPICKATYPEDFVWFDKSKSLRSVSDLVNSVTVLRAFDPKNFLQNFSTWELKKYPVLIRTY